MAVQYDAFISYRHTPLDSRIAKEIQNRLERAPIPAAIQRQTGKKRINRVFRDKEELPITSDINDDITLALQNSQFLIVICSENTRSSIWVQREIDEFLKTHDISRVLTVLADGEPQDVIPETLRFREELVDGVLTRKEIEPLSCDFRSRSRKVRNQEFPRLLAVILGCSYDDLRQRQRRRRMQQLICGLLAGLVLVSGIAIYALDRAHRIAEQAETIAQQAQQIQEEAETIERQAQQIQEEYNNTLITQSRYLSEVSEALLQTGDRKTAIQVALAALPDGSQDDSRPVTTEALYALNNALYSYRQAKFNSFVPDNSCTLPTTLKEGSLSPEGTCFMALDWDYNLSFFDMETSRQISLITEAELDGIASGFLGKATLLSENRVALYFSSLVVCMDYVTGETLWSVDLQEVTASDSLIWSTTMEDSYHVESDSLVLALEQNDTFYICRVDCADGDASLVNQAPSTLSYISSVTTALSPEGTRLAVSYYDGLLEVAAPTLLFDLSGEELRSLDVEYNNVAQLYWLDEDRLVTLSSDYESYGANRCNYSAVCQRFSDGETLWIHRNEHYAIQEDTLNSLGVKGQLLSVPLRLEDEGEVLDVLLAAFGNRLTILSPEDGSAFTYAEFHSTPEIISIGGKDRLFLALRDGSIIQYIPRADLIGDMGSIDSNITAAAYSDAFGKYAMVKSSSTSLVFIGNEICDPDGISLTFEGEISTTGYLTDGEADYRYIVAYAGTNDAGDLYNINLYSLPDTEPMTTIEYTGTYPMDTIIIRQNGTALLYWVYRGSDDCLYLAGWDCAAEDFACQVLLSEEYLSVYIMYALPDGKVAIPYGQGILLADPATETVQRIESSYYCYEVTPTPDFSSFLLLEENEDYNLVLRKVAYPSLEEEILPAALAEAASGADKYAISFSYSPQGNYLAFASGDCFTVADTGDYHIVTTIPVSCASNCSIVFLSEQIVALCGNNGLLQTWDISTGTMIMADRFTHTDAELSLSGGLLFSDEGGGMGTTVSHCYRLNEDGTFAREFSVENSAFSWDASELTTIHQMEAIVYPTYTLDQLIDKAKTVIDGELLSDADRIKYYIDN